MAKRYRTPEVSDVLSGTCARQQILKCAETAHVTARHVRNRKSARRIRKTNNQSPMSAQTPAHPKPKMPHAPDFMNLPKPVVPKTENRKLLKGQKAIVTGASSGIGRSIALALGHAGADVCINYVAGADKAQAMVDELRGHGHIAFAYRADVSNEDDVAKMFKRFAPSSGRWTFLLITPDSSRMRRSIR